MNIDDAYHNLNTMTQTYGLTAPTPEDENLRELYCESYELVRAENDKLDRKRIREIELRIKTGQKALKMLELFDQIHLRTQDQEIIDMCVKARDIWRHVE